MITKQKIEDVWKKGRVVDGYDPDIIRKDACGAWIVHDKYGIGGNPFGWVIDFIRPVCMGGDDNIINLRPLHVANNTSKGNNYPSYIAAMTSVDAQNVRRPNVLRVNPSLQEQLDKLYSSK